MATKIQKAEKAMRDAESALKAEPNNGELKKALLDAETALEEVQKPKQQKPKEKKSVAGLKVICRKDGFWRAGRLWTKEPRTVALDSFSKEQVEQLKAEPMLIVEEVSIED